MSLGNMRIIEIPGAFWVVNRKKSVKESIAEIEKLEGIEIDSYQLHGFWDIARKDKTFAELIRAAGLKLADLPETV